MTSSSHVPAEAPSQRPITVLCKAALVAVFVLVLLAGFAAGAALRLLTLPVSLPRPRQNSSYLTQGSPQTIPLGGPMESQQLSLFPDSVNLSPITAAVKPPEVQTVQLPPKLTSELLGRILGKAPLRVVTARKLLFKGCWRETLECGHQQDTFQDFLWDDGFHLVLLEPTAKRRRCRECRAIALGQPKQPQVEKFAVSTGAANRAEEIPAREGDGLTAASVTNAVTELSSRSARDLVAQDINRPGKKSA